MAEPMPTKVPENDCPCGSKAPFKACCSRYMERLSTPTTAEQLMRSRYTAFYKRNIEYIAVTSWPQLTDKAKLLELKSSVEACDWYGLTVLDTEKGGVADSVGTVEFSAVFCTRDEPSKPKVLREKSFFIKNEERWFYTKGNLTTFDLQLGRNDPCWCGSGKKHKKCHYA